MTADTPEEFLAQLTSIRNVVQALAPFVELLAEMKRTFAEAGFSNEAAELLTIEFTRKAILPYVGPKEEIEGRRSPSRG